jgi:hypothetical protein
MKMKREKDDGKWGVALEEEEDSTEGRAVVAIVGVVVDVVGGRKWMNQRRKRSLWGRRNRERKSFGVVDCYSSNAEKQEPKEV